MLIKSADDKSKRLTLLESLSQSPVLTLDQKDWAQRELKNQRYGIQGERDAAHYIDNHFADSKNHAVIHDLRIEFEGEVAQIDHLLISRTFDFYLLETKNFNGSLSINEFGEFTVQYGPGKRFGIPSPLEQSRRHENVLKKLLMRLEITSRFRRVPEFNHVVLIHPKGTIDRPATKKFDSGSVIKADQFATWREKFIDRESTLRTLGSVLNVSGRDTVREWAEKIVRQHRPMDVLGLPEFMSPRVSVAGEQPGSYGTKSPSAAQSALGKVETGLIQPVTTAKKRCICATCGLKISFAEAKFCWGNEKRFGELQYCREHQAAFR